ncbi:MAG: RluA family pseudouridine synthase, partial [Eubacteriales bacterium]|nr:RluA family pseudouridine synthase [Eubacteriales bacterium]
MSNILTVKVSEKYAGKPAKAFLRDAMKLTSRSLTVLKNKENGITRNGELLRTIDILQTGDLVTVKFPEENSTITP